MAVGVQFDTTAMAVWFTVAVPKVPTTVKGALGVGVPMPTCPETSTKLGSSERAQLAEYTATCEAAEFWSAVRLAQAAVEQGNPED